MEKIRSEIIKQIQSGVHNIEIVKTIQTLGDFLNAETISDYSKRIGKDYNSIKYAMNKGQLEYFELFGVTFIIDNL